MLHTVLQLTLHALFFFTESVRANHQTTESVIMGFIADPYLKYAPDRKGGGGRKNDATDNA